MPEVALVHVVGEADTGLQFARTTPEPERRARLDEWRRVIGDARGDELTTILHRGWLGDLPEDRTTPLPPLLGAIGATEVELVLVAGPPESDGVPSGPVADGLRAAFTAAPDILGPKVATMTVVTATGFDDDGIAGSVRAALDGSAAPVVMSWGTGSTGIGLGALAGVVESGRPWSLRDSFRPAVEMSLLPDVDANPLASWLLRLGYPRRLVDLSDAGLLDPPADPSVVELARRAADRLDRVVKGSRTHTDLAEWVRCELRRRDHSAALAVRSWLEARYEAYVREEQRQGLPAVDLLARARRRYPHAPTLGGAISKIESRGMRDDPVVSRSLRTRSGRWLLRRAKPVDEQVKDPAHRWTLLPVDTLRMVQDMTREGTGGPTRFGASTGIVRVVWGVGTPSAHTPPYAQTLLSTPLDARVLAHTGRTDRREVELQCLLLASSAASAEFALTQQSMLDQADANGAGRYRTQVVAVGERPRGGAVAQAEAVVRQALDGDGPQPDVIVVVPVGEKPVVAAAFAAAVAHGREHAIPVLIECTDLKRTEVGYHRVGAHLAADDVLGELAADTVRQLDLDTATRLLGLCSPPLQVLAGAVRSLAGAITSAVEDQDHPALLTLFRVAAAEQPNPIALLRLAHLAGTLGRGSGPSDSGLGALRNQLPTAHGHMACPTAGELVVIIDRELGGRTEPRLADDYRALLAALQRLTADRRSA